MEGASLTDRLTGDRIGRINMINLSCPNCGCKIHIDEEIIRCKDCKHHHYDNKDIPYCDRIDYGYGWKDDDFCSLAERREE